MKTSERIYEQVKSLPEPLQQEVLDFAGYLAHKFRDEDADWSALSLTAALRGLEHEAGPEYRAEDFKEKWE